MLPTGEIKKLQSTTSSASPTRLSLALFWRAWWEGKGHDSCAQALLQQQCQGADSLQAGTPLHIQLVGELSAFLGLSPAQGHSLDLHEAPSPCSVGVSLHGEKMEGTEFHYCQSCFLVSRGDPAVWTRLTPSD